MNLYKVETANGESTYATAEEILRGRGTREQAEANVALLAAAPVLLAACERALRFVNDLEQPAEVADKLRAAINQAKEQA